MRHRNEVAGATYHVIARGVDRRRIFVDGDDYETYTRLLQAVQKRQGWNVLCFCLMPNHVHHLIETPEANLANGIQWIHGLYARHFNVRHDRKGHLFEAPYKSPMITSEAALVRTVGYIVVNPVAAALSRSAGEWPWASHPEPRPTWVAHDLLQSRLEAITGRRCYDELIGLHERAEQLASWT